MSERPKAGVSIADQIPQWYEGGTKEQMLDEAFAQIRMLESRIPSAVAATEGSNMEAHSLMLELCHRLGCQDGDSMYDALFLAVEDARRYRWLRDKATFANLGAAQVQGAALDHACDKGLKNAAPQVNKEAEEATGVAHDPAPAVAASSPSSTVAAITVPAEAAAGYEARIMELEKDLECAREALIENQQELNRLRHGSPSSSTSTERACVRNGDDHCTPPCCTPSATPASLWEHVPVACHNLGINFLDLREECKRLANGKG